MFALFQGPPGVKGDMGGKVHVEVSLLDLSLIDASKSITDIQPLVNYRSASAVL